MKHMDHNEAAAAAANMIGALIEQMVEQSGLTEEQIAEGMGVTVERLQEIINGDGNVRISTLARIAYATGHEVNIVATGEQGTIEPRRAARQRNI